jgi:tripartite-type tricarboxylate transporter receptor subunit TctC
LLRQPGVCKSERERTLHRNANFAALSRRLLLASALGAAAGLPLRAEQWPSRRLTLVVPYPAGGGSDVIGRPIAADLTERLDQPMVVDNRSGAAGTIGTAVVARAPADGYTLLLGDTGLIYEPTIYPSAGYDFERDFAAISGLARMAYVLVVNPNRLAVANVAEFVAAARRRPGAINVGSAGLGSVTHLAIGLLQEQTDIKLAHVPYRGGTPMLQDLLAGQTDAAFVLAGLAREYVASGKLRALVVANRHREPLLPGVPAAPEAGLGDFRATIWFGMFAPRQTDDAILDRLHGLVQQALATPALQRLWQEQGARVEPESRAEFARFVARDTQHWIRIARAANIRME